MKALGSKLDNIFYTIFLTPWMNTIGTFNVELENTDQFAWAIGVNGGHTGLYTINYGIAFHFDEFWDQTTLKITQKFSQNFTVK
jgi:hypothetical protein